MLGVENWMRRFIPFAMHGDGVRFSKKGNNLVVLSMSFVLCSSEPLVVLVVVMCINFHDGMFHESESLL